MIKVWILIIYMGGYRYGGPTIIDGIATQQECERVQAIVTAPHPTRLSYVAARCIEVWKVRT